MNIILVRHGETYANITPNKEPTLTQKGKLQIKKVSEKLKDIKVDAIYSSDLQRASLTAKEIQKKNKCSKLIYTSELQEIYRVIIGGELKKGTRENRYEEDLKRANLFWKKMCDFTYQNVIIVSHGNLIRFFLSKALKAPANFFCNIQIDPASISIINILENNSKIVLVNDVSFMSKELLTSDSFYFE
jgi:broad specificity phosphatase PhoE